MSLFLEKSWCIDFIINKVINDFEHSYSYSINKDFVDRQYLQAFLQLVLYCIQRPYIEDRLDRYGIGIPELSEIRTQPWLIEGALTCDSCHQWGPIFNDQGPCFHIMNGMLEYYL